MLRIGWTWHMRIQLYCADYDSLLLLELLSTIVLRADSFFCTMLMLQMKITFSLCITKLSLEFESVNTSTLPDNPCAIQPITHKMSSPPPQTVPPSIPKTGPELSESETDEEEEREETKGITLSMIPPLRYLYKNKTLKQVVKEAQRFPHRADLLDRVSLLYVSMIS